MNLAQEIQSQVIGIPTELQAEILDFIKFVKQQRQAGKLPTPVFPSDNSDMGVAIENILQPLDSQVADFFLAAALYHARKMSFSASANLAGLSFDEFAARLSEHFGTGYWLSDETVREDIQTVRSLRKQ